MMGCAVDVNVGVVLLVLGLGVSIDDGYCEEVSQVIIYALLGT